MISGANCKKGPGTRPLTGADPPGFTTVGLPEVYDEENLFAYMNGEAEAYFPFGFRSLFVRSYQEQGNEVQMFVEAYDMGTSSGAHGIFEAYTRRKGSPVPGLGDTAWTDNRRVALFCRGRYFFRVLPDPSQDVTKEATPADLLQLSRALDKTLESR